jgi:hypothetical protein
MEAPTVGHTSGPMRIALTLVAALALAVSVSGSAATPGDATVGGRATLKVADTAPLKLRGNGFLARERVRVTVSARGRGVKRVIANAAGSFVVAFEAVSMDRCSRLVAVAVGSQGSRASLKRPQPQCPPPL